MDKIDQKIIKELLLNSRIPLNQLGKKIRVGREVVLYRMNRMFKNGIIKNFYAVVNTGALGFFRYSIFVQLKNVTKEKEKEIFEFFEKHKATTYMSSLIGRWNFAFDMLAKSRKHLNQMIKDILSKFSNYIKKYVIIETTTEEEFYPTKLVGMKSGLKAHTYSEEKQSIDSKDRKILRLLSNNSRMSYAELSKKVGLSANAIRYKIKEMQIKGIIIGYSIFLDIKKIGRIIHNLQIRISNPEVENKIKSFLREDKRALYFYKYVGNENWDFDIGIIVRNEPEVRDFLHDLRENFGEDMEFNDLYLILDEGKPYLPEIIFED
ncbi:MAG: AsnC family transcriptional regulator [Nanoarchaeota archaeon]|nr:AsnC family transcriptional regulator [Nanoarchaeota archaeon]MBU1322102.1 AsnC family transcriptional regulator [Nanoarchaeota archaeon]MBU1598052.1 AsnC family transcriptional regulator [Nanoarchaeota archaeon]MBU2440758.1 AsnC family transcriptional regulator [Nanoarchaeota archaeon]